MTKAPFQDHIAAHDYADANGLDRGFQTDRAVARAAG
jgi:hypothetical protein